MKALKIISAVMTVLFAAALTAAIIVYKKNYKKSYITVCE